MPDANGLFELDHDPVVHRYLGQRPVTNIVQSREMIYSIQAQHAAHSIGRWAVYYCGPPKSLWAGPV